MSNKNNWGNQSLPDISNDELLSKDFAKKVLYSEFGEMNRLRAKDHAWQEANLKGAEQRKNDPDWQNNHRAALDIINNDETITAKRLERIQEVTSSEEWKLNQLEGVRTVRANNPDWKGNIAKGHEKLRETDEYWKQREEVAERLKNDPKHREAVKEGVKGRWDKPENLSDCKHCGMVDIDNANYTLHHGDKCWLKDKILIGFDIEGIKIQTKNVPNLYSQGYSLNIIKERVKKGGKHKKLKWRLENISHNHA